MCLPHHFLSLQTTTMSKRRQTWYYFVIQKEIDVSIMITTGMMIGEPKCSIPVHDVGPLEEWKTVSAQKECVQVFFLAPMLY